jgi:hypothetical protein
MKVHEFGFLISHAQRGTTALGLDEPPSTQLWVDGAISETGTNKNGFGRWKHVSWFHVACYLLAPCFPHALDNKL